MKSTINCNICNTNFELYHKNINIAVCPFCKYVNRIFEGQCINHTQNNLVNSNILSNKIVDLKLILNNNTSKQVIGIYQLDYNEANLYFFYIISSDIQIFAYFEYQWYELTQAEKINENLQLLNIESGEYYTIFNNEESYVINKETGKACAIAGQLEIPIHKKDLTIVEHSVKEKLYFSFYELNQHLKSFLLTPVEQINLNNDIIHSTLEHTCKLCKNNIIVEGYPFSKSFVCTCGAAYFIENFEDIKFLYQKEKYEVPFIKLNSICTIDNIKYKVIGHVTKEDTYGYFWEEFTLWNIENGYMYLSCYKGNWIKLTISKLKNKIATNRNKLLKNVFEDGKKFSLYNDYKSSIIKCVGSFAGNILNDKEYSGIEYIAPPNMWAFEKPLKESVTAFKGEYIDGKALKEAFNNNITLPIKTEIGAIEPKAANVNIQQMFANFVLAIILLLSTQFISNLYSKNNIVYEGNADFSLTDTLKSKLITPIFEINKSHSNLSVKFESFINNAWLQNEIELINIDNGETINTEQGIEYYSGYEDGYSWNEGSKVNEIYLSYLKKGKYQASFIITGDTSASYHITITEDVSLFKNFWFVILFIAIPSTIFAIYNYNIEANRWRNSAYNPYNNN